MKDKDEKLSPILENYLEIIFHAEFEYGLARTGIIAEKAEVSSSTVTSALKSLQKLGYLTYQPYKLIRLTEKGKKYARKILHKHAVLKEFFFSILNLDEAKANHAACEFEHMLDEETFTKLSRLTLYLLRKPSLLENWEDEVKQFLTSKKNV